MIWSFLALVCIIIGIALAAFDGHLWFDPLVWFVLAIAFNTLDLVIPGVTWGRRNDGNP